MKTFMKTIAILLAVLAAAVTANGQVAMQGSARANVGAGNNVLILGFIGSQNFIARGLGPTIASYLPPGTQMLNNPFLAVYDANGNLLKSQHSYTELPNGEKNFLAINGLTPVSTNECAIFWAQPGPCTAVLSGENGSTGIGLVDVYYY